MWQWEANYLEISITISAKVASYIQKYGEKRSSVVKKKGKTSQFFDSQVISKYYGPISEG